MAFRPITDFREVPDVGDKAEDLNLDFKGEALGSKTCELAKDVAAFANASGGTILVGAHEGKGNVLQHLKGLATDQADKTIAAYQDAVNSSCSPKPLVTFEKIPWGPDIWLVAINVWPYALLPVAVRVRTTKDLTGKEWDTWAYWMRIGTHNNPLSPEQAAMLMIPSIRNTLTLLDSIPEKARDKIVAYFFIIHGSKYSPSFAKVVMKEIKPLQNVAHFTVSEGLPLSNEGLREGTLLAVPLDAIETVWEQENESWALSIQGSFARAPPPHLLNKFLPKGMKF